MITLSSRRSNQKYEVRLQPEQRQRLGELARNGHAPAKKLLHARALLLADENDPGGQRPDRYITEALGLSVRTLNRVRRRFALEGEGPALDRKPRLTPPTPPKLDTHAEAHLVALCCSDPPEGHARWTLRLLARELTRLEVVTSICPETVRRALKKNELKPWRIERFCIPERDRARFVAQMEDVLDQYALVEHDEVPLICMDEAAPQIVADVEEALPAEPGRPRRQDYHYERLGTRSLFMFLRPQAGWRRMAVREHRTRVDWAEEIRCLLDEDFPDAPRVRLVCDNLNTHHIASLYETFDADTAHRLARRLEIHYTPRNGSWLNAAEIELSALERQCLHRRFDSLGKFQADAQAWVRERNHARCAVRWLFQTTDARDKLRHLYPHPTPDKLE
jgi:hypothetical protein